MNDDLYPYDGNLAWLRDRTILLVTHGSRAYGLHRPESDVDIKGVAVPPREYFLGFSQRFEQAESHEPDMVVYDVRKFCSLAADCNPNIIEVLWCPESCYRVMTPAGRLLVDNRDAFLSKKARHTFSGYAHSQLKRIETHHRWIRNPPKEPPTRADLGLPERTVIPADQLAALQAAIAKRLDEWNTNFLDGVEPSARIQVINQMAYQLAYMGMHADGAGQWRAAARSVGCDDNFIRVLDLERQYESKRREWEQFQTWKRTRNPARAELEAKHGYDTKHAMHLVRLLRMCREILETGKVVVERPDREELLSIRDGAWSYDRLVAWAGAEDRAMDDLYARSTLPKTPDRTKLDALCMRVVESVM